MVVYCVTVYVKTEHVEDFIAATVENHLETRKEPGNLRFDVLQCADDPSRFFLYEVYRSPEAVQAHKETEHYKRWREQVADWMAKPREGIMHRVIRPTEESAW